MSAGSAFASAQDIDFNISAPSTGEIYTSDISNGDMSLVGSNIEVDTLVGLGTALHSEETSLCLTCVLNFETGNTYSYNESAMQWSFSGGGSISIEGGVDFLDSAFYDIPEGSLLLDGTFNEATVISFDGALQFTILGATFEDEKHPDILAYYGFDPYTPFEGGLNISFTLAGDISEWGEFSSASILSGDVVNHAVPLPAAVWFFVTGLFGLGLFSRKTQK